MTGTMHQPCTRFDMAEVIERATALQMGMLMGQVAAGPSFAYRDGQGVAVACGGFVPVAEDLWEAWFCVNPETGPRAMVGLLRAIALTLRQAPYPAIQTEVGTPFGARIAKALGFEAATTGNTSPEVWFYGRCNPNVQKAERHDSPCTSGSDGQPAPRPGANGQAGC
jgi:hypothetical protein